MAVEPRVFDVSVNLIINEDYLAVYLNDILLIFNLNSLFVPTAEGLSNTT